MELLDLSSSWIEFRSLSAATANALSPYVFSLAFGVTRLLATINRDTP